MPGAASQTPQDVGRCEALEPDVRPRRFTTMFEIYLTHLLVTQIMPRLVGPATLEMADGRPPSGFIGGIRSEDSHACGKGEESAHGVPSGVQRQAPACKHYVHRVLIGEPKSLAVFQRALSQSGGAVVRSHLIKVHEEDARVEIALRGRQTELGRIVHVPRSKYVRNGRNVVALQIASPS